MGYFFHLTTMINSSNILRCKRKSLTNVGWTNLGIVEIVKSSIGSESLFTKKPRSDWTKPLASLSGLQTLFDGSYNMTALLQG